MGLNAIRIDYRDELTLSQNSTLDESAEDDKTDTDCKYVHVCGLIIDIEAIPKQEILKLRKMMPKKQYLQLKARKTARECRKKRKGERN